MPCFRPIPATQDRPGGPVKLWPPIGTENIYLPCGKCLGCQKAKAAEWGLRTEHEARRWRFNIFITPTYDEEHLPAEGHLVPADLHKLNQAIRNLARRHPDRVLGNREYPPRYFQSGQYGDKNGRPHYHSCHFNTDFPDAYRVTNELFESEILNKLWSDEHGRLKGQIRFGRTLDGAGTYTAGRYTAKDWNSNSTDADGVWREPPFVRMSRRPAIGHLWLDKYATDARKGFIHDKNGVKHPLPRSYKNKISPLLAEEIDWNLEQSRRNNRPSSPEYDPRHPDRLRDAETIATRQKELYDERRAF